MGEPRDYTELSEEKTEPFSQTEIQVRLHRSRADEFHAMINSTVPLDDLLVPPDQDIRILMRPLVQGRSVSPGERNCTCIVLNAEVAEPEESQHKVLAVKQTSKDISFTVTIPDPQRGRPLCCQLYYDPTGDNQVLVNRSDVPFTLSRISHEPSGSHGDSHDVNPSFHRTLAPGTWRINMDGTDLLDFRILEKRTPKLRISSVSSSGSSDDAAIISTAKRLFDPDDDEPLLSPEKRRRSSATAGRKDGDDSVIVFLPAKGKELATSSGHPLLDLQQDETLVVPPGPEHGYTITKKDPIAATSASSVFTAEHSRVPAGVIVVKVLKTRSPATAMNEAAVARDVVRQAHIWLREVQSQGSLNHENIVRLHGGDARFLSLYMEHVDARDLSSREVWLTKATHLFSGDRSDGLRILRDIADALHYIHGKGLVHNDIKPGNILYSRDRGAVLCDLGLTTSIKGMVSAGGTPWYVPPEFIGLKQRGCPSDVWALGVTMLYVMGKIAWPDARAHKAHPRHLHWMIAELNSRVKVEQPTAATRMRQWLNEVNSARSGLDIHDKIERLVYGMLAPNPKERVTTKDILSQFPPERC
ncbi:kinase-like protein [Trichocladium antarcticum]|uniref:Kinase-like protein n=1 Tax=Trichocladium antarcticum TaxID=1450529 RepID=A0AAN6UN90_9PEZI|nr:kinase-like protein [Trichocladium antarcticum]